MAFGPYPGGVRIVPLRDRIFDTPKLLTSNLSQTVDFQAIVLYDSPMSIETEYEFIPCYKGGRCEDAPCCGCGDDNRYLGEYDHDDHYEAYEDDYDEYDDDDEDYEGGEDIAMESSLFGDC